LNYQQLIDSNPVGSGYIILKFLAYHVGRENAIKRRDLLEQLHTYPGLKDMQDRHLRIEINRLRKEGQLICSAACEDGGYFMAGSLEEYTEFAQRELGAKIADMSATLRAMEQAARQQFGDSYQPTLI